MVHQYQSSRVAIQDEGKYGARVQDGYRHDIGKYVYVVDICCFVLGQTAWKWRFWSTILNVCQHDRGMAGYCVVRRSGRLVVVPILSVIQYSIHTAQRIQALNLSDVEPEWLAIGRRPAQRVGGCWRLRIWGAVARIGAGAIPSTAPVSWIVVGCHQGAMYTLPVETGNLSCFF